MHLYSEKKGRNSSFSLRYSFYLGSKMFSVYSEVRCAAASKSCAIVFGYRAQPSCSAFLPGALGDSQGPVKPVCVCERSLGPDSAPNRPAIGGGGVFRSPAAPPLAFSGTCSWLQTVAAGMLIFIARRSKNKSLLLLARAACGSVFAELCWSSVFVHLTASSVQD